MQTAESVQIPKNRHHRRRISHTINLHGHPRALPGVFTSAYFVYMIYVATDRIPSRLWFANS